MSWNYWLEENNLNDRSEVVRNIGLPIVAIVAGLIAVWRSRINQRQVNVIEQGQITDRYTDAVKMLAAKKDPRTRVGAVYALARIAQDSVERDHIPVMEVLTEFIRNPPYQKEAAARADSRFKMLAIIPPLIQCPDILAALQVIAERSEAQRSHEKKQNFQLSLRWADLGELDLRRAKLNDALLVSANLSAASLFKADLTNATLINARLADARLHSADLSGADLMGTTGLTKKQIAYCKPSEPPINIPDVLYWPFVKIDGKWVLKE